MKHNVLYVSYSSRSRLAAIPDHASIVDRRRDGEGMPDENRGQKSEPPRLLSKEQIAAYVAKGRRIIAARNGQLDETDVDPAELEAMRSYARAIARVAEEWGSKPIAGSAQHRSRHQGNEQT
jgi:hypothetical protein